MIIAVGDFFVGSSLIPRKQVIQLEELFNPELRAKEEAKRGCTITVKSFIVNVDQTAVIARLSSAVETYKHQSIPEDVKEQIGKDINSILSILSFIDFLPDLDFTYPFWQGGERECLIRASLAYYRDGFEFEHFKVCQFLTSKGVSYQDQKEFVPNLIVPDVLHLASAVISYLSSTPLMIPSFVATISRNATAQQTDTADQQIYTTPSQAALR